MKKFLIKTCAFLILALILNACTTTNLPTYAKNGDLAGVKREFQSQPFFGFADGIKAEALENASREGHLEIVKYLLSQGIDINMKASGVHGVASDTALMIASGSGHLEIVQYLVEQGAGINITNCIEETALMWASENGHLEVVKYLVEKGADMNVVQSLLDGGNAFTLANDNGHLEVADYLASKGAEQEKPIATSVGKSLWKAVSGDKEGCGSNVY